MKLKNYFQLSRFWMLVRLEAARSRKGVLMTLGIIFGFVFFVGLLLVPVMDPGMLVYEYSSGYTFTLLIGGFILSSLAFRDLGSHLRRYNFLMLPVSTFERFLTMWLMTSAGWIIMYTSVYTIYTLFATSVGQLVFRDLTFLPFDPFGQSTATAIKFYFVLQGVFLAGAAQFKGYALPKTLLAVVLLGSVCGGIIYLMMKDMFNIEFVDNASLFEGMAIQRMWMVLQWIFWWLLAPVSWLITFLGLKEQEV